MKNRIAAILCSLCALALLAGCASAPVKVDRVDSNTQIDLSGYWNDTDLRIVSESLIKDCLGSERVVQFAQTKGRLPVVIVGVFANGSDEHIDTTILTKKLETAILNSGKADFVASKTERSAVRDERNDQQGNASEKNRRGSRKRDRCRLYHDRLGKDDRRQGRKYCDPYLLRHGGAYFHRNEQKDLDGR